MKYSVIAVLMLLVVTFVATPSSSFAEAKEPEDLILRENLPEYSNVLATFQDSRNKNITYEVVNVSGRYFFRTSLESFVKLNGGRRIQGKRAALDVIQVKLVEYVTRKKNFSVTCNLDAVVTQDHVLIDLERATINGWPVNVVELILSDSKELLF